MLSRLGVEADASTAVVIFPEGRLFRPERLQRTMARLGAENIQRAARLATLTSTLPPRPGGVLALLDAMPGTDVVVIAHAGLDRFASFSDLARAVPLRDPICVVAWRIPADLIPTSVADRIRWLDEQWVRLDDWVKLHSPA
jgi:hypothetical protein